MLSIHAQGLQSSVPSTHPVRSRATVAMQSSFANEEELKSPVPWLPRPSYLDGELAGDVGLDPLGLVTVDWLSPLSKAPGPIGVVA